MSAAANEELLHRLFAAAVASAQPANCVPPNLPAPPRGRTIVVGAGKATAAMAATVEAHWNGPMSGVVATRHGHGVACRAIEVIEAGHPLPDEHSVAAAGRIAAAMRGLTGGDLVLCLVSGGGSALLAGLPAGVTLDDEHELTAALLRSGAPIAEINCVRKHISTIRGGRLARLAAPARLVTLAISDVAGDDPAAIASGPTVADPTTRQDAIAVLIRDGVTAPPAIAAWLANDAAESPKPGALPPGEFTIVADARRALDAAARIAAAAGFEPIVLGDAMAGTAGDIAARHVVATRDAIAAGRRRVLLSGGEAEVVVTGNGRGGRNGEFLLAFGQALGDAPSVWALAADTDGIDGGEDNAGAIWTPGTPARAAALGLPPGDRLAANDSYGFFEPLGQLVTTGPTLTNVNDFRAVLIDPAAPLKDMP